MSSPNLTITEWKKRCLNYFQSGTATDDDWEVLATVMLYASESNEGLGDLDERIVDCQSPATTQLAASQAEVERLRGEVERLREACSWYGQEAEAISRNTAANNVTAITASMAVLSLDAGSRYAKAIQPAALSPHPDQEASDA